MPTERGVPIAAGERRGLRICSAAGDMDWRARWPVQLTGPERVRCRSGAILLV